MLLRSHLGVFAISRCDAQVDAFGTARLRTRFQIGAGVIVGVHRGKDLMIAGRARAGFVPATRREVYAQIKGLKVAKCPFANLPQKEPERWGQGLMAEKMKSCVWVKPERRERINCGTESSWPCETIRIRSRWSKKHEWLYHPDLRDARQSTYLHG